VHQPGQCNARLWPWLQKPSQCASQFQQCVAPTRLPRAHTAPSIIAQINTPGQHSDASHCATRCDSAATLSSASQSTCAASLANFLFVFRSAAFLNRNQRPQPDGQKPSSNNSKAKGASEVKGTRLTRLLFPSSSASPCPWSLVKGR